MPSGPSPADSELTRPFGRNFRRSFLPLKSRPGGLVRPAAAGDDRWQQGTLRLLAGLGWGDAAARGLGAGVQPPVPDGDDQFGVADGQGAGEVDGVGSA